MNIHPINNVPAVIPPPKEVAPVAKEKPQHTLPKIDPFYGVVVGCVGFLGIMLGMLLETIRQKFL